MDALDDLDEARDRRDRGRRLLRPEPPQQFARGRVQRDVLGTAVRDEERARQQGPQRRREVAAAACRRGSKRGSSSESPSLTTAIGEAPRIVTFVRGSGRPVPPD